MKLLLLLCLFAPLTLYAHKDKGVPSQSSSYGERGSDLGMQVFQQVAASKPLDNVVFSPHGVASILGMLLAGAHGRTRKQMVSALRYKKNGPYKMLRKLHKSLTAKSNQDAVLIANGLFSQEGFSMEPGFVRENKENLECKTSSLDFSNPQAAADEINEWVRNSTRGHISGVIRADMLDPALTRLVAVNSIYFKGLWKARFLPVNTKMKDFHAADGTVSAVPMMSQLSVFKMGVDSTPLGVRYSVIELPYEGNRLSMLIVLPYDEDTPLSRMIPHINTSTVRDWTQVMRMRKVHLVIPKFSADAEVDLKAPLSALGLTDMFSQGRADFKHLSAEAVYVSNALQKAKIEVNEDGTKASAATTAILMARSFPPWITVDRPFLFLIRHNPSGTILFVGQINKP
ncbi:glia-derived nexin [Betta splendens]|uniref:Glia-derived nexin n=1 Tax=Betta splendens TaxID=158456 RepID=A0A6P7P9D4_BETSP|nr:glia-derived nexin [Betta splendens]